MVKNSPANAGDLGNPGSIRVRQIPWRRAWQTALVFLPGESHGQRSLVGFASKGSQKVRHDRRNLQAHIEVGENQLSPEGDAQREGPQVHRGGLHPLSIFLEL